MRQALRRVAVQPQQQMQIKPTTLSAPIRGIVLNENPAFMQPNGALDLINWFPTQYSLQVRGGSKVWCTTGTDVLPVLTMFSYKSGTISKIFASNATKIYEATFSGTAAAVITGQADGNYSTAQLANAGGDWLICVNDAGDYAVRYNGTAWTKLAPGATNPITGPAGSAVATGQGLTAVWKHRRRLYFIQGGTMNAWYLDIDAVGGALQQIPLSGSFTRGGALLFGCTWSTSSGDGIDDKCVFVSTEGEAVIFSGSNPGDNTQWSQQGRFEIGTPMGKNAFLRIGGDVMFACTEGIFPLSEALYKDRKALQLSAITRLIYPLWKQQVSDKNDWPWTMCKWDELGAIFVTWPGALPGNYVCGVVNVQTGAWSRFTGWDATCFITLNGNLYFGTQTGTVMQGHTGGTDIGQPYTCTYVGGWEVWGNAPAQATLRQARVSWQMNLPAFINPQIGAATNYTYTIPSPPSAGPDPGAPDYWDEGHWDVMHWDASTTFVASALTSYWVSIGETGYSHAPMIQVTISQGSRPDFEFLGMSCIVEQLGIAV